MTQFGTSHHALQPPELESGCTGAVCDVSSALLILVVLFGAVLGTLALLGGIRRARDACSEEIDRVLTEREAFEAFVDRIADLDPVPVRPDGGPHTGATLVEPENVTMARVRAAYRETVMDVPHYEDDYAESLEEHMAAELGDEVAAAVVGNASLTPSVRRALLATGRTAKRDRGTLLETLEAEHDDLTEAQQRLESVSERFERTDGKGLYGRTFYELESRWRRLNDLERDCNRVLARRQETLHERGGTDRVRSPEAISGYLYSDLDVSFPVLAAGTDLIDELQQEKGHTLEAITSKRA